MADEHADTPDNPADEVDEVAAQAQDPTEQTEAAEQPADEASPTDEPAQELVAEELVAELVAEELVAEEAVAEELVAEELVAEEAADEDEDDEEEPAQRVKPAVPGAHLEVDIVPEGVDPLGRSEHEYEDPYALEDELEESEQAAEDEQEEELTQPIATAAIDLASGARYRATGKRKTAIARVTLRPGTGEYLVNGRPLDTHFPRTTLQRNIRQPLETVGYQDRMDVIARLHGGGISAQAGALRHGVSRALLEADPNLRGELKRRGFLTRDSRAKERKKAGLKKARKRPQFSKR
jgi:small subunit ribosomal protein S9